MVTGPRRGASVLPTAACWNTARTASSPGALSPPSPPGAWTPPSWCRKKTTSPLPERCRRVNDWCRLLGKDHVILISIHSNAAGRGDRWLSARGWCAYTTRGATRADALATCLYEAARLHLPGMRLRTDYTDADPDLEKDFYVLRHTLCPSVLVENLFMDNPSDCAFLLSEEGQQSLVDLHVDGICDYKSQILIWPKPNL